MKDLLTLTIVGVLLFWVMLWPEPARAIDLHQDSDGRTWVRVFSF
jgi:hypothetical protein